MKSHRSLIFSIIPLLTVTNIACAGVYVEDASDKSFTDSKAYIGISSGAVLPIDLDYSGSGSVANVSFSAAGSAEFDEGYTVSGLFGYKWNDCLRTELEFGHSAIDAAKVTGSGTATYGGSTYTVTGSANIDADIDVFYGLANVYINPLSHTDLFSNVSVQPYIGAGVGFADITTTVDKIGTLTVGSSEDNTDLLVNAVAGFEYELVDNITADLRYRYFWVDSGRNGFEDGEAHSVNGSLRYSF